MSNPQLDHDSVTGFVNYVGFALPDALETDPGWRIYKTNYVGDVMKGVLWPGGVDTYTNIWANRAALSYVANPDIAPEATDIDVIPTGTRPGTGPFTVPVSLTPRNHILFVNGFRQTPGGTGQNEYTYAGRTFQTGGVIEAGWDFVVRVRL